MSPKDQDYVTQELTAFFLSWLYALPPPVLNRPTPQGLCGSWRHPSEWVWLAAQAGLSTPSYRQTSRDLEAEQHWQGHLFPPIQGRVSGWLQVAEHRYPLEHFSGVYNRLMDDRRLPELAEEPAASGRRRQCRALHEALIRWCELTPARVVNRTGPMGSNFSKPYQAQLIRAQGFAVPETLITNDPAQVHAFRQRHRRVIYKSISGVRSIVRTLEPEDDPRLEQIRWCPTQFQAFVEGTNVRVHTVGTAVFATAIHTTVTDYRYTQQQGSEAALQAIALHAALAERCVRLARALGLAFAGIDLKMTSDNQVYCFEVNPSPAFSYYEAHTEQPIAQAVARYLAGLSN